MSMYDHVRCQYPLPMAGATAWTYQSKDTPDQYLSDYEIRVDGTLWVEEYDIVDRSDPYAQGIARLAGMMTRVHRRWVPLPEFNGAVVFGTHYGPRTQTMPSGGWLAFRGVFRRGHLITLGIEEHELPRR